MVVDPAELAEVQFWRTIDQAEPPEGFVFCCEDAGARVYGKWIHPQRSLVAASDSLLQQMDIVSRLPWPLEEIGHHDFLPITYFRRNSPDHEAHVNRFVAEG